MVRQIAIAGDSLRGQFGSDSTNGGCPKGTCAGTWTSPDTLVFDMGSHFDLGAPRVPVLKAPAPESCIIRLRVGNFGVRGRPCGGDPVACEVRELPP
jgi:hypothetical protein